MQCDWYECDKPDPLTPEVLEAQGIYYEHLSDLFPATINAKVAELMNTFGYVTSDEVNLMPHMPNIEELKEKFSKEHNHTEDEVRLITAGEGIFDIRTRDNAEDGWMRIYVEAGDLIIVPAGRYHRFYLTDQNTIGAKRLFKDTSGWVANFR